MKDIFLLVFEKIDLYFFSIPKVDIIGWIAALINASSFFFKDRILKFIFLMGSTVWIIYGLAINSKPVIVANLMIIISISISFFKKEK